MDSLCEGCRFHNFPYQATLPILIDGKRELRTFTCEEDVHDIIKLLIRETKDFNNEGRSFDIALSVSKQMSFFSCMNILYNQEAQKDIWKYIYCKDFNIPAYSGSYGEQPKKWIDKTFIMKGAFAKREKSMIDKHNREVKNGSK